MLADLPTKRRFLVLAFLGVVGATLLLRWPNFSHPIWNLDESIHAAISRTLLDGGVLYRDAIDQRTPVTYYVMAGIFAVAGENNLWAVHLFTALLVGATAGLVYRLMLRWTGWASAAFSALLYMLLATGLYYQGDANAFVTEWFVAFFSTAAACVYWSTPHPRRTLVSFSTGLLLGLSFLSKQPGLLDLAAPLLTTAWLAWRDGTWRQAILAQWIPLVSGWLTVVLASLVYFAAHGSLDAYIFYAWTYNLTYYGPEISWAERAASLLVPFRLIWGFSPYLLAVLIAAVWIGLRRLVQRSPTPIEQRDNPATLYLLVWGLAALAAGASGGRGFDHYFIQLLPALVLAAGWLLGRWAGRLPDVRRPWPLRLAGAVLLAALLVHLAGQTLEARRRTLPDDPSMRAADFIRRTSRPDERIFVWGYHPDIYLLADRKPASRFVYASYLSGLIPWSNVAPGRDTAYAIVPGAMDTLLRDLEKNRPAFFVDCSAGPNRYWQKYPLEKFPRLLAFVRERYTLVQEAQFVPQGFRVYLIRDKYRRTGPVIASPPASQRNCTVGLDALHFVEAKPGPVRVYANDPAGRLTGIDLLVDGQLTDGVSIPPSPSLNVTFEVPFDRYRGEHRLQARARCTDGLTAVTELHVTDTRQAVATPEELAAFSLPVYQSKLNPVELFAPFGAQASLEDGTSVYFTHAPARLLYPLPDGARAIRGSMGFRPGAYAPTNPTPTDGAEFRIDLLRPDGSRTTLFRRLLQPLQNPAERGLVPFRVVVPPDAAGRVEFLIEPGPAGNASSDWTYWADLALETSR